MGALVKGLSAWPLVMVVLMSCGIPHVFAQSQQATAKEKNNALQELRTRISNLKSDLQAARSEETSLMFELQRYEIAAADVKTAMRTLESRILRQTDRLKELLRQKDLQTRALDDERKRLADLLRAAHKTGRHHFLKLLLNQEDPAMIGRNLAYHSYLGEQRLRRIDRVNLVLQEHAALEDEMRTESDLQQTLLAEQKQKLDELDRLRVSRLEIVMQLQKYIADHDRELQSLMRNEQELSKLLMQLQHDEVVVERFENLPPFTTLKGRLNWPLEGKLVMRFGAKRKGGRLKSHGVMIAANPGQKVKAVSSGKVIFADWFRNKGLLLILDHGNGYMSLYGHNETLLKKKGDWVIQGEIIARAGDTGGQESAGLYFEIRQDGEPVDPGLWCKR